MRRSSVSHGIDAMAGTATGRKRDGMTEPEVGRKVRQLGEDVYEIYELLDTITKTQRDHSTALANLSTRFDGVETRVNGLDTKFTGMFERVDAKVDRLDAKFTRMFADVDARFDALDAKFTGKFDSVDAKLDIVLARIGHAGD